MHWVGHQSSSWSSHCQKHQKADLDHLLETSQRWMGEAVTTVGLFCGWKVNSSCSCCAIDLCQESKPVSNINYWEWLHLVRTDDSAHWKCIKPLKQACLVSMIADQPFQYLWKWRSLSQSNKQQPTLYSEMLLNYIPKTWRSILNE